MEALSPRAPRSFPARVLGRAWLSARDFALTLERPSGFDFLPGQGLRLAWRGREREYTIISTPADPVLELCIRRVEGGGLTEALARMEPRTTLEASGPHGYFAQAPGGLPVAFVATGIGITPFVAMARSGWRAALLLHGVRDAADLHYAALLRSATDRYVGCVSRGAADGAWSGRVTGWLERRLDRGAYAFYLCGGRGMIADVVEIVDRGFPGSRVFSMAFG